MPTLADIRQQYPDYKDLSDEQLTDGLYKKFYSDMPRADFNKQVGFGQMSAAPAQQGYGRQPVNSLPIVNPAAASTPIAASGPDAQSPPAKIPSAAEQTGVPWWLSEFDRGLMPFGLSNRLQAGAAAAKEALSGGLPFAKAYDQALATYNAASAQHENEHPIGSAVASTVGSLPTIELGGGLVNGGLKALGTTGRFLAGTPDLPTISLARNAAGRTMPLTAGERAANAVVDYASKAALAGREGAQAGAYGAANNGQDVGTGALTGIPLGLLPQLSQAARSGIGAASSLPGRAFNALPDGVKMLLGGAGAGAVGAAKDQLLHLATAHPIAAAATATAPVAAGATALLARYPELARLLGLGGAAALPGGMDPQTQNQSGVTAPIR